MRKQQLKDGKVKLNTESHLRNKRGETIRHGLGTATFAEYSIVDQSQVVPIPKNIPLDRAALLACAVITGVGAVVNTAKVKPGSSVAIIGIGGVGLNAIQGAVLVGAYPIIAIDRLDNKLTAAKIFGATHTINTTQQETPEKIIKELTSGRGVDYVFVTVGSATAVTQGFYILSKQGTEVIVGIPEIMATVSLPIALLVVRGQKVMGSYMGSSRLSVDVPWLVELYQHGRIKLDELITARYPLEQINEAIEAMENGESLRNMIVF